MPPRDAHFALDRRRWGGWRDTLRASSLVATLGASLLAAGACGPSDSDGDSGTAAAACERLATTKCAKVERCGALDTFGSRAECERQEVRGCQQLLALPDVSITPNDMLACALVFTSDACGDQTRCVFPPGKRAVGDVCGHAEQCAGGWCSAKIGCGRCGEKGKQGEPCGNTPCADGLTCTDQRCAAPLPTGGACSSPSECGVGDVCLSGVCSPPVPLGGACSVIYACAASLVCADQRCSVPPSEGEPCSPGLAFSCGPSFQLTCVKDATGAAGTCRNAKAKVGEPCGVVGTSLDCAGTCVANTSDGGGVCQVPGKLDEPCGAPDFQRSTCGGAMTCIGGKCTVPSLSCG